MKILTLLMVTTDKKAEKNFRNHLQHIFPFTFSDRNKFSFKISLTLVVDISVSFLGSNVEARLLLPSVF